MSQDDPFSDWIDLVHKPVYSIDGRKLGVLRKILLDFMIVESGLINLTKYFIPKALAGSVSDKGIKLRITAYEARSRYSYVKMKNVLINLGIMPEHVVLHRAFYDRFLTIKYSITRNRLAAGIAFVSGILFLLSGYKANLAIYQIIREDVIIYTAKDLWIFVLAPVGILAILSQLGGLSVLMGAGLFAANRVNLGKFLISLGTGQGLFTIIFRILVEIWSTGHVIFENNYVIWLTSSATGVGILFAVVSQSISKGKGDSIAIKFLRLVLGRMKRK